MDSLSFLCWLCVDFFYTEQRKETKPENAGFWMATKERREHKDEPRMHADGHGFVDATSSSLALLSDSRLFAFICGRELEPRMHADGLGFVEATSSSLADRK